MSSALIGCLFGALFSGYLSDRFGRKLPLVSAAVLFTVAAIGTGAVNHYFQFILFRVIGGLAIGIASAISPIYIAEIAPAKIRGRLVSVNQLTIVIGILAAQIINYLIAEKVPAGATDEFIASSWNGQMGWRWMFWAGVVPSSAFFLLALFIPESPRYLAKAGKQEASLRILHKIGGPGYAQSELGSILETLHLVSKRIDWKALGNRRFRPLLILGIVLAVFQQWCGINVIFNYAEEVFTSAGYSVSDMLLNIVITGSVNLVFTLVAMRIVDNWGRRKMMLMGSSGLAVIYILLGSGYYFGISGVLILVLVVLAIAIYALTACPGYLGGAFGDIPQQDQGRRHGHSHYIPVDRLVRADLYLPVPEQGAACIGYLLAICGHMPGRISVHPQSVAGDPGKKPGTDRTKSNRKKTIAMHRIIIITMIAVILGGCDQHEGPRVSIFRENGSSVWTPKTGVKAKNGSTGNWTKWSDSLAPWPKMARVMISTCRHGGPAASRTQSGTCDPAYAPFHDPDNIRFPYWLQPVKKYTGAAWYRRTFDLPDNWTGKMCVPGTGASPLGIHHLGERPEGWNGKQSGNIACF